MGAAGGAPPPPLPLCLPPGLRLRPPDPTDAPALRSAHTSLFPVDYEDAFYDAVLASTGGVFGLLAEAAGGGDGRLAGFVTARLQCASNVDAHDAAALGFPPRPPDWPPPRGPGGGLSDPSPHRPDAVYLLTLGVAPPFRRSGLARALVAAALARGAAAGCRLAYLHAATFNDAAAGLYAGVGFAHVATFPSFYTITTGRQPDPAVTRYDAMLLATELVGGGGSMPGPLHGWTLPTRSPGAPPPTPRVSICAEVQSPPDHAPAIDTLTAWLACAVDAAAAAVAAVVDALMPTRAPPPWAARLVARGRRVAGAAEERASCECV